MAREPPRRVRPRGGDRIPPHRAALPRLAGAIAALAVGAGLATSAGLAAGAGRPVLLGALGVACLAVNAVRASRGAVYLGVACLAAQYAWPSSALPAVLVPLYAAGFVTLVELACWSLDLGAAGPQPPLVIWHLARIGLLAGSAVLLASLVLALASLPLGGPALLAAAAGAATTLWAATVLTLRRLLG